MAKILLTNRNLYALIDDEDYERVSKHRWHTSHTGIKVYVQTTHPTAMPGGVIHLHRFVMKAKKGQIIDHINGNPLDNRKENLRFCTPAQNAANRHEYAEVRAAISSMRAPKERRGLIKFKGWMRRPDRDKPTKDGVFLAYEEGSGKIFHFPPGVHP